MPFCDACGKDVFDTDQVCRHCGETIVQVDSALIPASAPAIEPLTGANTEGVTAGAEFGGALQFTGTSVVTAQPCSATDVESPAPPIPGAQNSAELQATIRPDASNIVLNRFVLVEVQEQGAGWIKGRAMDTHRCAECGAFVERGDKETAMEWCGDCGASWRPTLCGVTEWLVGTEPPEGRQIDFAEGERRFTVDYDAPAWTVQAIASLPTVSNALGASSVSSALSSSRSSAVRSLQVGQASDTGQLRSSDEDSVFCMSITRVCDGRTAPVAGLFIVADGMGGAQAGEVASRLAVEAIAQKVAYSLWPEMIVGAAPTEKKILMVLTQAVQDAHCRVMEQERATGQSMGSTVTLSLVVDQCAYVVNIGDSRTYLWREGCLIQISRDHSAVAKLVEEGQILPEEVYTHPDRNVILRCLGIGKEGQSLIDADTFVQPLQAGDKLVHCCDGLWEMVRDPQISDVVGRLPVQEACDALVQFANANGGDDNISIIVVSAC